MDLKELYEIEGRAGLNELAEKVGTSPRYLWQCATTRREPSPRFARRLVKADPRLTLNDIYAGGDDAA